MTIELFVSDAAVLSSLEFSLAVEGLAAIDGAATNIGAVPVTAVVIDRGSLTESLDCLASLRAAGCAAPAIILATNPSARQRACVAAAGAVLIEKPLLDDELTCALRSTLYFEKAA